VAQIGAIFFNVIRGDCGDSGAVFTFINRIDAWLTGADVCHISYLISSVSGNLFFISILLYIASLIYFIFSIKTSTEPTSSRSKWLPRIIVYTFLIIFFIIVGITLFEINRQVKLETEMEKKEQAQINSIVNSLVKARALGCSSQVSDGAMIIKRVSIDSSLFESVRNWDGQNSWFVSDGEHGYAAELQNASSTAYLFQDIVIPKDAEYITFDYLVENQDMGAIFSLSLGDRVLCYDLLQEKTGWITSKEMYVGNQVGKTLQLLFTLDKGYVNSTVFIRNLAFKRAI
jgi:hypothetical protein